MLPNARRAFEQLNGEVQNEALDFYNEFLKLDRQTISPMLLYNDEEYSVNDNYIGSQTSVSACDYPIAAQLICNLLSKLEEQRIRYEPITTNTDAEYQVLVEKLSSLPFCLFIEQLGDEEIYVALQYEVTAGTTFVFPPFSLNSLILEMLEPFPEDSNRSKVNVARAKHCQRGDYWGVVKGSIEEENRDAYDCAIQVLSKARWINVFILTKHETVLEVRVEDGHGLRYTLNNDRWQFRGLLEPFISKTQSPGDSFSSLHTMESRN